MVNFDQIRIWWSLHLSFFLYRFGFGDHVLLGGLNSIDFVLFAFEQIWIRTWDIFMIGRCLRYLYCQLWFGSGKKMCSMCHSLGSQKSSQSNRRWLARICLLWSCESDQIRLGVDCCCLLLFKIPQCHVSSLPCCVILCSWPCMLWL